MALPQDPCYQDPAWLWAQNMATRRMVLALARCLDTEPAWRQQSQAQLQQLHALLLNSNAPESALLGVEEAIDWISKTGPG